MKQFSKETVTFFVTLASVAVFNFYSTSYAKSESGYGLGIGVPEKIEDHLIEIDVSGSHGRSAPAGRDHDGYGRAGRSSKGVNGGHSPQPQDGMNSGNIDMNLDVVDGNVTVFGMVTTARGRLNPLNIILDYGTKIRAVIRGGNGGSGNRGGNGQQGGKGHDGTSATRYSSATSGGRGGSGGDAGRGSHGAHAGNGGTNSIGVSEQNLELLLLVDTRQESARGGTAGCHGVPGEGGPGGDGGSGCSWTETEHYTTSESDGKGGTRTVSKTRTVHKSRPPAPDGPRGYRGKVPTVVLQDGLDGAPGKIIYNVKRDDGSVTQTSQRFQLLLKWYQVDDEHKDGILEPGDKVFVKNMTVANEGELELPHGARIFVSIGDSKFTLTNQVEIEVPNGLKPGESITFSESLEFVVKKGLMPDAAPEPFVLEDSILPRAFVVNQFVNEELDEFRRGIPIAIQYPIRIESITRLSALAPGEASKFSFKVSNISSQRDFGSESELKRAVQVWVQREGGDLNKEQVEFFDTEGYPIDIRQQMQESIALLKPGQSAILEGLIGVREDADLYRSGVVGVGIDLDTNDQKRHNIQHVPLNFSATASYNSAVNSHADYLLIATEKMRRDTFEGWNHLTESIGSDLAIWDLSYYSFLDLLAKIGDDGVGGETTLAKDFAGKTIVIPDYLFEYAPGQQKRATDFLKHTDLLAAQEKYGINFLVISDRGETRKLFEELRIGAPEKFENHFRSTGEMLENLEDLGLSEETPYTQTVIRSLTTKRYFFGSSNPKHLKSRAEDLALQLGKIDANNEYIVVHRYKPHQVNRLGKLFGVHWFPKYSLGSLEVRRRANKPYGLGVHMNDEEYNINSVPFIYSQRLLTGLLMATPIEKRISLLQRIIDDRPDLSRNEAQLKRFNAILDSIQFDIINEIQTVHIQSWKGKPSVAKVAESLPTLKAFVDAKIQLNSNFDSDKSSDDPQGRALDPHIQKKFIEIAVQLKAITEHSVPWYDLLIPGRSLGQRINKVLSDSLAEYLTNTFQMRKQTWSWFGRLFDSKKNGDGGFVDHDINNLIASSIKSLLIHWNTKTLKTAIDSVVPGEFQSSIATSLPVVLAGKEADALDNSVRFRSQAVVGNEVELRENREKLMVPNPGTINRWGEKKNLPSGGSCIKILE